MSTVFTTLDTPAGPLLLAASDGVLTRVWFGRPDPSWRPGPLPGAAEQMRASLAGERHRFDLPWRSAGTPFQERVWAALDGIPYGHTVTYGTLAERVGAPRDRIRAVAAAVGANPLLVVRPCHRVVGSDGTLTGYAGGLDAKRHLLTLEGALQDALFP
ncbi:methylated-DNA--[protein]-cysteine S-methyltransferase [Phytohabitans sp. ZYX-F-186]|uniref:Methylated-DNA--protein-cysteine methyltransferase n=1 Tax=Phytohabitans maris TaxID=3071409 RepID=A0ABU0ZQH0_9ACTN|nr:methylated-DNA--[protein]-cysteine S-methyltransferase [Phytohabitans sp. ZYX-F-186]MDQ7909288.1 methylated-DNA--[protein]-cysteine S-methyltransferase [Phytohabitans sp. ZYX-F-186]